MSNTESNLKLETYTRKPFDVKAVQITHGNHAEVAKWCGGEVTTAKYKMMGQPTVLPAVKVPGSGPNKGKMITAMLNHWVVEHQGCFRVYRNDSFDETFDQKTESGLQLKDYVTVTNRAATQFGWVGQVVELSPELVGVSFESRDDEGQFHPSEIEKYEPSKNL